MVGHLGHKTSFVISSTIGTLYRTLATMSPKAKALLEELALLYT
jgi:hypothetical protein